MAIKGFEKKDPMESFNQLMQIMNQMDAMGQRKIQNDRQDSINFQSRINDTRTLDSLTNILPSVNDHNQNLELSGNEKFNVIYSDKHNAYKNANSAYEKAKLIQNSNLENPDMLAKDLLKGGWEGAAAGIMDIDNLLDDIDEGDAYKFRYAGNEKYSQTGLKKALLTRRDAYTSVMELLDDPDNAESFLVVNPDGSMDEDTAALLDKLKFNIVTGDVQEVNATVKNGTTGAITDYNKYSNAYVKWNRLSNKILDGKTTVSDLGDDDDLNEMLLAYGLDESSPLDEEFINTMKATSLDLAKKANKRHKVFTGKLYNEDPFYKKYDDEEIFSNLDEMGMGEQKVVINDMNTDTGEDTEPPLGEVVNTVEDMKFKAGDTTKETPENIQANFNKYTEDNFNKYVESDASEGGIDFNKVTSAVILGGAAASTEPVQNVAKSIYKATKDGARYLNTAYNLSGKDINYIMKEINKPKGTIKATVKKIERLEKALESIKNDPNNTKKNKIKSQINKIRKNMVESLAKRMSARPEDIARVMTSKEMSKWNPVRVKDYFMNKAPGATKKWLKTSTKAKVGTGLLRYRTGAAIKDAIGFDLGEGFVAETAEDVATTAAATGALNKAGNWVIPKIKSIATSPSGRKALQKFLGKQAGKFLIKQAAGSSVPGVGNIAMAVVGAGMSINDFVQFLKNYREE